MFAQFVDPDALHVTSGIRLLIVEQIIPVELYRQAMRDHHTPRSLIVGLRGMLIAHPEQAVAFVKSFVLIEGEKEQWPKWMAPDGLAGPQEAAEIIEILWQVGPATARSYVDKYAGALRHLEYSGGLAAQERLLSVLARVDVTRAAAWASQLFGSIDLEYVCTHYDLRDIVAMLGAMQNSNGALFHAKMLKLVESNAGGSVSAELCARIREESDLGVIAQALHLLKNVGNVANQALAQVDLRWIEAHAIGENLPTQVWEFLAIYDEIDKTPNNWARRFANAPGGAWARLAYVQSLSALNWTVYWLRRFSVEYARRAVTTGINLDGIAAKLRGQPPLGECARAWMALTGLFEGQPNQPAVIMFLDKIRRHILSRCDNRTDFASDVARVIIGERNRGTRMDMWQVGYLRYLAGFSGVPGPEFPAEAVNGAMIRGLLEEEGDNLTLGFALFACQQLAPKVLQSVRGDLRDSVKLKSRIKNEYRRQVKAMLENTADGCYQPEASQLDWFIARMYPATRIIGG
jgi:hypothetical protein